ncbi:MAG: hypothetical protein GY765_36945 [bacterium]|nr:hypothetical protein [bacterium]
MRYETIRKGNGKHSTAALCLLLLFILPVAVFAAKAHVAKIVDGEKGCTVKRTIKGKATPLPAKKNMPLYPGDILIKNGAIDTVEVRFGYYAGAIRKNDNRKVIVDNFPAQINEMSWQEFKKHFKMEDVQFFEVDASSRTIGGICFPGVNATVLPGREIFFQYREADTLVVSDADGKEILRRKIDTKGVYIKPEQLGMQPGREYTWELSDGRFCCFRSTMRLVETGTAGQVEKDLKKLEKEKLSAARKGIKKAAYLQFVSDVFPGVNLYWFGLQELMDIRGQDDKIMEAASIFVNRSLACSEEEVSEAENSISIRVKMGNREVSPGRVFSDGEAAFFSYETACANHVVILYRSPKGVSLIGPHARYPYRLNAGGQAESGSITFYDEAEQREFLFIVSGSPIPEMEQYYKIGNNAADSVAEKQKAVQLEKLYNRMRRDGEQMSVYYQEKKAYAAFAGNECDGFGWFRFTLGGAGGK